MLLGMRARRPTKSRRYNLRSSKRARPSERAVRPNSRKRLSSNSGNGHASHVATTPVQPQKSSRKRRSPPCSGSGNETDATPKPATPLAVVFKWGSQVAAHFGNTKVKALFDDFILKLDSQPVSVSNSAEPASGKSGEFKRLLFELGWETPPTSNVSQLAASITPEKVYVDFSEVVYRSIHSLRRPTLIQLVKQALQSKPESPEKHVAAQIAHGFFEKAANYILRT